MKDKVKHKKRYANSKIVCVRYHKEELAKIDEKREKTSRSNYIRLKSLK